MKILNFARVFTSLFSCFSNNIYTTQANQNGPISWAEVVKEKPQFLTLEHKTKKSEALLIATLIKRPSKISTVFSPNFNVRHIKIVNE